MLLLHRNLLRLAGDLRGPLIVTSLVGWTLFATRVLQAVLVGAVLGAVLDVDGAPPLVAATAALAAAVAARMALVWARDLVSQRSANAIKVRMREQMLGHLLELGPGYTSTTRTGEVQASVVDGVEGLEAYYSRYLPLLVIALTGPVLVVTWMLIRAPLVGGVVLLAVLSVPLLPRLADRLLAKRGKEHWEAYGELGADYLDAMQGMTTLKALDATDRRRRELRDRARHLAETTRRQMSVSLIDAGLTALGTQVGVALAVGVGAVQVARGQLDVATLAVLLILTAECFRPFQELSAEWHAGFLGVSAADGIHQLLDAPVPSPDPPGASDLQLSEQPPPIRFERVALTYPGRERPALDGLDLDIPAGATVAIVGRSGAGKTSLVAALVRAVPIQSGTITVGGIDIGSVTSDSLRCHVAVVSQDAYLFHGTIADNLRLADPTASDERLWWALSAADAEGFVRSMPERLENHVGERGTTLSGGQRQRIAIARAILTEAPILVLDEPTSAVDADTEARILRTLEELAEGRTTLVIAHRLSTIRGADRIAVMRDGCVVEQGTHDELLDRSGDYRELVDSQSITVGSGLRSPEAGIPVLRPAEEPT